LQARPHVAQQPPPCCLHLPALPLLLCCCPVGLALQVQLHHRLLKLLQPAAAAVAVSAWPAMCQSNISGNAFLSKQTTLTAIL
jgi:hypothetical protein